MDQTPLQPSGNLSYKIKQSLIIAQSDQMRVVDQTLAPGESVPWQIHPDSEDYIICLRGRLQVRENNPERLTVLRPLERHRVTRQRPHTTKNVSETCPPLKYTSFIDWERLS
jgi:quercetin dioxygenase-like cupin family protein